jgi:hypothetical protein
MNPDPPPPGPRLRDLFGLFPASSDLPEIEYVTADEVPEPYHTLLVHNHHMTVTVEAHHGSPVDVRVLDQVRQGDSYARKILLTSKKTGAVVQFGLVRIWLPYCDADVQQEILAGQTPLGRILIQHDVLRWIQPTAFVRVLPDAALMSWFGARGRRPTFGRLAYIHCDGKPAIELLEIVAPE